MKFNKVINVERRSWILEGFNKKIMSCISNKYINGSRFKVRRQDL